MIERFIKAYYNLFDEKIGNGTSIVCLIALIIVCVGYFKPDEAGAAEFKVNILETQTMTWNETTLNK